MLDKVWLFMEQPVPVAVALMAFLALGIVIVRICVHLSARRSLNAWNAAVERCRERDKERASRLAEEAERERGRGNISAANRLRERAEHIQGNWGLR